jgi:hypothetical protein
VRESAHILNIFVEKINRDKWLWFSQHETATQKVCSPTFLQFSAIRPEVPFLLARIPFNIQMPWNWRMIHILSIEQVSYLKFDISALIWKP